MFDPRDVATDPRTRPEARPRRDHAREREKRERNGHRLEYDPRRTKRQTFQDRTDRAVACMAPIFGPPVGTPRSGHLRKAALAILETQWRTPYHYDLFKGDVGHTLVLGATGAGKSFALNFLLVQALQYDPRVLILDLGGSYRWLTQFLGGGYMELSPGRERGRRVSVAALLASQGRAQLPVPHRVDIAPLADRRMDAQRGRP